MAAILLLVLFGATLRAEDKVILRGKDGKTSQIAGTVVTDALHMVAIKDGQVEIKKPRIEVAAVRYGDAPKEMYAFDDPFEAGDYITAEQLLKQAYAEIRKLRDRERTKLIMQHWLWRMGELSLKQGEVEKARRAFTGILNIQHNSARYFASKIGEARSYEESSNPAEQKQAGEKYSLWVRDFQGVKTKYKLPDAQADPWILVASLGALRMKAQEAAEAKTPDKALLQRYDKQLDALVGKYGGVLRSGGDVAEQAARDAKATKALVWRGQENWGELVKFLDKQVMEAQLKDQRDRLFKLYVDRANANFEREDYRASLLDYLRLWLIYEVQGENAGMAHYRIGQCFLKLGEDDAKKRARSHFIWARKTGAEPFATMAGEALKAVRAEDAEKAKPETGKEEG